MFKLAAVEGKGNSDYFQDGKVIKGVSPISLKKKVMLRTSFEFIASNVIIKKIPDFLPAPFYSQTFGI